MGNACCGGIEQRKAGVVVADDNDDEYDDPYTDDVEYNAAAEKREKLILLHEKHKLSRILSQSSMSESSHQQARRSWSKLLATISCEIHEFI
jgi:hypothetical protein